MNRLTSSNKSGQLDEVNFLRPIVIILLVLLHSFTMYNGGWPMPSGIHECTTYAWIAKFSYSCMLETFTFISGYLFGFAIYKKGKQYRLKELVYKKFKRLIIPSIVFSILYSLLFYEKSFFSLQYIYDILNGLGHMWYLPMLFWCFIASHLLLRVKFKEVYKLIGLSGLAIFSFLPLPLQLSQTCYYLFFFYAGIYLYSQKEQVRNFAIPKSIILNIIGFVTTFIALTIFRDNVAIITSDGLLIKVLKVSTLNFTRLIYAAWGCFCMMLLSIHITSKHSLSNWIIQFNKYCFGIYLLQQFCLLILYYKTALPEICGTHVLPWVGFSVTIFLSTIIAKFLLKTEIGKKLI